MGTRGQWAKDFLAALGNPSPTAKTINLVSAWTRQEFGSQEPKAASYNPLATTLDYGTNTAYNSVNVRNYATRQEGIEASVITLRGNYPGYAEIVAGLRTNDPERALVGMRAAPWGTNFGRVEQIWRAQDVTGEPLPGEDPSRWKAGTPAEPDSDADSTVAETVNEAVEGTAPELSVITGEQITGQDVRWAVISMAGGAAIALGGILVVVALAKGNLVNKTLAKVT